MFIGHFGGIIIRGDIGKNCSVAQGVTIGAKGAGKSNGWPVIGDNVFIGAGAKIIGKIKKLVNIPPRGIALFWLISDIFHPAQYNDNSYYIY